MKVTSDLPSLHLSAGCSCTWQCLCILTSFKVPYMKPHRPHWALTVQSMLTPYFASSLNDLSNFFCQFLLLAKASCLTIGGQCMIGIRIPPFFFHILSLRRSEASLCQARYVWRKVANSCFHSYSELLYPMGSYKIYLKYTLCFHLFCYSSLADGKRLSHPCWSTETYAMSWRTASVSVPVGCFSFLILGGFWDGSTNKLCCKPLWPT